MKKILVIFIFLSVSVLFSQSIERQLIGSASLSVSSENFQIFWGAGEVIIGSPSSNDSITMPGFFHIEIEEFEHILIDVDLGQEISIKRTSTYIQIVFGNLLNAFKVRLYNLKGQTIKTFQTEKIPEVLDIPIRYFSSGITLLTIFTDDNQKVKSYKLTQGVSN